MSSRYSANQYENAFNSYRLQNWTVPKHFKERPSAADGYTTFIATDRGHLLPGVKRGSSRTSFQGTWDLPNHIPPVHFNPTARSNEGQERLRTWGKSKRLVQSAPDRRNEAHVGSRASNRTPAEHEKNTNVDEPHEVPHTQASASTPHPGQEPITEEPMSATSQAQSRPASQQSHAEPQPASNLSKVESRPTSQQNQVGSRPLMQANQTQSRSVSQTSKTG